MPIDFKHVKKQFEKSMADYDKNAVVQEIMATKMVTNLSKISTNFENILEIGTGTGLLTKHILKNCKCQRYCGNDIVEKSKVYLKKIIPDADFICGNAIKVKFERKFDLIISNAVFQWFENTEKLFATLKSNMKNGGLLAFSTFSPDNFREITELTGLSLKYKSENELVEILKSNGFEVLYDKEFEEQLEFNSPLELLAHMKKTGVNSLSDKTWTVKHIKTFCDEYSKKYQKQILTYSPIIIIARLNSNPVNASKN